MRRTPSRTIYGDMSVDLMPDVDSMLVLYGPPAFTPPDCFGMYGAVSCLSSAQLMLLKKGCALISSAPWAAPKRFSGSRSSSAVADDAWMHNGCLCSQIPRRKQYDLDKQCPQCCQSYRARSP